MRYRPPPALIAVVIGVILVAAALLKADQVARHHQLWSRDAGLAASEFIVGSWLVTGVRQRQAWWTALLIFSAFAAVSLVKLLAGEPECGCFGQVAVAPWVALSIDLAAVALLISCAHEVRAAGAPHAGLRTVRMAVFGLSTCVAVYFCSTWLTMVQAGEFAVDGLLIRGEYVIADPSAWLGRRLPLLEFIEAASDLGAGDETLVFYRAGCKSCEHLLDNLARRESRIGAIDRIVVVAVTTDGHGDQPRVPFRVARLCADHKWVIDTPLIVGTRNGVVVRLESPEA